MSIVTRRETANLFDHRQLEAWLRPGARVLDLGCGDGSLLFHLQQRRNISGYGLEIAPENITACIDKGINVIEQDIDDRGLASFATNSFDCVLMTQTLQVMRYPEKVLQEMLRIGTEGIVTFPNFGYLGTRLSLLLKGRMPVSRHLPESWYDTRNIHFCTINDFEALCRGLRIRILDRIFHGPGFLTHRLLTRSWPNLFATTAIYRLRGPHSRRHKP